MPYGLWRLPDAQAAGYLLLLEGESDPWTAWHHELPALGLPGADMAKLLEAAHLEGIRTLYVAREPDRGGETLTAGVAARLAAIGWTGDARTLVLPDGFKDLNAMHCAAPDRFPSYMLEAFNSSVPLPPAHPSDRRGDGHGATEDPDDEPSSVDLTEDALTLEFTRRHRDALRYVHDWGRWLHWHGTQWAIERTLAVYDLARRLVHDLGLEIDITRVRARIQSAATVNAIVALARTDRAHAQVTEDFDADPWLLNTPAGTVDLRTGEMRAHRREDGLTKVTPVAPGDGEARLWRACLKTWTKGDEQLEAFLQRLAGYCLTGSVKEEVLPIVHGPGANGKTRFVETLRACLGHDYVTGLAMETLIVTKGEQHPADLADLRGKRLAIAVETEEGRRLAEAKVKALTGGDRIRARYMRRDFFEFAPTHKLWIVGNHRPALQNVDEALRRRLLLIPFDAVIPPDTRDPDLADKLLAEYPAILRWMIEGCLAWQAQRLCPPARVLGATEGYLETADAVGRWLGECCVVGPNETMTKAEAFTSWKAWAEAAGEYVGSGHRLGEYLSRLPSIDEARLGKTRTRSWIGIGLRREEP